MNLTKRLALLAALAVIHPAMATTVVAFYSREAVYLGADSKFVDAKGHWFFHCKISTDGQFEWASSGLPIQKQGSSVPGGIRIPEGSIARAASFSEGVVRMNEYIAAQLPEVVQSALEQGATPLHFHGDIAFAGFEDGTARLSISGFARRQFGHPDYDPIECRPVGASDCQDGELFSLGFADRINALMSQPGASELVAIRGAPDVIRYLISEEESAHPKFVGGPISIVRLDGTGVHWVRRGLCH